MKKLKEKLASKKAIIVNSDKDNEQTFVPKGTPQLCFNVKEGYSIADFEILSDGSTKTVKFKKVESENKDCYWLGKENDKKEMVALSSGKYKLQVTYKKNDGAEKSTKLIDLVIYDLPKVSSICVTDKLLEIEGVALHNVKSFFLDKKGEEMIVLDSPKNSTGGKVKYDLPNFNETDPTLWKLISGKSIYGETLNIQEKQQKIEKCGKEASIE